MRRRGGYDALRHDAQLEERSPALVLAVALGLLRRQIWMIAAITLAGAVLTGIFVSTLEKSFTATTLLMLDQRSSGLLEANTVTKLDADGEVEILKSDNVALRVVERLQLAGTAGFDPKPGAISKFIASVRSIFPSSRKPATAGPSPTTTALRILMQNVVIRRRGLTDVIAVEATSTDPQRAADIANAYGEAYLEEQVDAKLSGIERAGMAVSRRLNELDEELKRSETQIGLRQIYQDNLQRLKAISQRRETVAPDTRIASTGAGARFTQLPTHQSFPDDRRHGELRRGLRHRLSARCLFASHPGRGRGRTPDRHRQSCVGPGHERVASRSRRQSVGRDRAAAEVGLCGFDPASLFQSPADGGPGHQARHRARDLGR